MDGSTFFVYFVYSPPSQRHNSCARHVEQGCYDGMKKILFVLALALLSVGGYAQSVGVGFIPDIVEDYGGYSVMIESLTAPRKAGGLMKSGRMGVGVTYLESYDYGYTPDDDTKELLNFSLYCRLFFWRSTRVQIPLSIGIQYGSMSWEGEKVWLFGGNASLQLKCYVTDRTSLFIEYSRLFTSAYTLKSLQFGLMVDISK